MNVKQLKIPARMASASLVNILSRERPTSFGNYFNFRSSSIVSGELNCLNMWAENLSDAVKRDFIPDGYVEVRVYGENEWVIVVDNRIPNSYLNKTLCLTGVAQPSQDILDDMRTTLGLEAEIVEPVKKAFVAAELTEEDIKNIKAVTNTKMSSTDFDAAVNGILRVEPKNDDTVEEVSTDSSNVNMKVLEKILDEKPVEVKPKGKRGPKPKIK